MTNMTNLTRARQELVSQPFALPGGRLVTAKLFVLASAPAGSTPAEPNDLQLVVEVRRKPEGDFQRVAETRRLPQFREDSVEVAVPSSADPIPFGERPPMARLRLIHNGTLQPRWELRITGL